MFGGSIIRQLDYAFYSVRCRSYSRIDYIMQKCGKAVKVEESIGPRMYLDYAPIIVKWILAEDRGNMNLWRLDNSLLMNKTVVDRVKSKISLFFQTNGKMPDKTLLWV